MEKEILKQLTDLWGKKPIPFHHFEFVTQDQLEKIINDTPRKYEKKVGSSFLKDQARGDFGSDNSSKSGKSYSKQGVEPNVWAKILTYKSSDNKRAMAIYEAVNAKYSRTIDWVSSNV